MATIPGGYNDATPETALKKLERRIKNGQVRSNFKAAKSELSELDLKGEPTVSVIDGEARANYPRIKTDGERRAQAILNEIKKTIAQERKKAQHLHNLSQRARYQAELDRRKNPELYKRTLLIEKLRRMEAGQWL